MKIKVFELSVKLYLLRDIEYKDIYRKIAHFIDSALVKKENLKELHNQNKFKNYTFNSFYPIERVKYVEDKIYTVQIRTIDYELAEYFNNILKNHYTYDMKGLTVKIKIVPNKVIDNIYSITPLLLKNDEFGYWKDNMSLIDFEKRVRENLIKKYNTITNNKVAEDFELFTSFEFSNIKPVAFNYKGKKILGDKVKLHISNNETAQKIAYLALGTGIGEMNARGAGYVNYKWI